MNETAQWVTVILILLIVLLYILNRFFSKAGKHSTGDKRACSGCVLIEVCDKNKPEDKNACHNQKSPTLSDFDNNSGNNSAKKSGQELQK